MSECKSHMKFANLLRTSFDRIHALAVDETKTALERLVAIDEQTTHLELSLVHLETCRIRDGH